MGSCSCDCRCQSEVVRFQAVLLRRGAVIYSPWMERRCDRLRATAELVMTSGDSLTVDLFTKKPEMRGNGTLVDSGTKIVLTTAGRQTKEWNPYTGTGMAGLVRYRFTVGTSTALGTVIFRMLPPIWFDSLFLS